jgi:hypothetical protein
MSGRLLRIALMAVLLGGVQVSTATQWVGEHDAVVSNGSLHALVDAGNARVRVALPIAPDRSPDASRWRAVQGLAQPIASRDAKWVVLPDDGKPGASPRTLIWDVRDGVPWVIRGGTPVAILGNEQRDLAVLSADGSGRQVLALWDVAERRTREQVVLPAAASGHAWQALALGSSRHAILVAEGMPSISVWDHDYRTLSHMHLPVPVTNPSSSLRLSPDGRHLAQTTAAGLNIYRVAASAERASLLLEWPQGAEVVGWTMQGRYVIARGRDGDGALSFLQFDAASGRLMHQWHHRSGADIGLAWLTRTLGRQYGAKLSGAPLGSVVDPAFELSEDGRWLAVAGGGQRGIAVLDVSVSPPRRVSVLCLPGECSSALPVDAELRWSPSARSLLVATAEGLWIAERETGRARSLLDTDPTATRKLAASMQSALEVALCSAGGDCPRNGSMAQSVLVRSQAALRCRDGEGSACFRLLKQGREQGDRLAVQFAVRHGCGLLNAEPLCGEVAAAYGCRAGVDGAACEDWPREWSSSEGIETLASGCAADPAMCAHVGLLHTTVAGKAEAGLALLQKACAAGWREACLRGGRAALELDFALDAQRFYEHACRTKDQPDCVEGLRRASLALVGEPQYEYNDHFGLEGNATYNVYLAIREEHWRCESAEEQRRLGMNQRYWEGDQSRARKRCVELRHEAAVERTRQAAATARAARLRPRHP